MIQNDVELECTLERIVYFCRFVAGMRVSVQREIFPSMAGGFLAEVEKMNAEVIEYLSRQSQDMLMAEAAK
jgi:hypothetical protein